MSDWDEMVVVGRIARPHGLRGHVVVNPETDFPAERFRSGVVLYVLREGRSEPVTVEAARFHQGRPILALSGVPAIESAEALAGAELRVPRSALRPLPHDVYYHHDLIGCRVRTTAGVEVGEVAAIDGGHETSRLIVRQGSRETIVPLAADICVEIDTGAQRIVIDPPEGLLDLNR